MNKVIWLVCLLPMFAWAVESPQTMQNTADIQILENTVNNIEVEQAIQNTRLDGIDVGQVVQNTRLDTLEAINGGGFGPSELPMSCVTGSSQGEIHIVGGWLSQVHVINSATNNNHVHIRDIEIFKIASFAGIQAKPSNSTVFIQISAAFGSIQAASVCMHDLLPLLVGDATVIHTP